VKFPTSPVRIRCSPSIDSRLTACTVSPVPGCVAVRPNRAATHDSTMTSTRHDGEERRRVRQRVAWKPCFNWKVSVLSVSSPRTTAAV
jgi:hypothetical protein